MAGVESRSFDSPDETRTPDKTKVDVVKMGGSTAARLTLEPGWSWGSCIKPVAGTDSCQLGTSASRCPARCTSLTTTEPSSTSSPARRT